MKQPVLKVSPRLEKRTAIKSSILIKDSDIYLKLEEYAAIKVSVNRNVGI